MAVYWIIYFLPFMGSLAAFGSMLWLITRCCRLTLSQYVVAVLLFGAVTSIAIDRQSSTNDAILMVGLNSLIIGLGLFLGARSARDLGGWSGRFYFLCGLFSIPLMSYPFITPIRKKVFPADYTIIIAATLGALAALMTLVRVLSQPADLRFGPAEDKQNPGN